MLKKGECNYLDGMITPVMKWLEGFVEKARDRRWKGASEVVEKWLQRVEFIFFCIFLVWWRSYVICVL